MCAWCTEIKQCSVLALVLYFLKFLTAVILQLQGLLTQFHLIKKRSYSYHLMCQIFKSLKEKQNIRPFFSVTWGKKTNFQNYVEVLAEFLHLTDDFKWFVGDGAYFCSFFCVLFAEATLSLCFLNFILSQRKSFIVNFFIFFFKPSFHYLKNCVQYSVFFYYILTGTVLVNRLENRFFSPVVIFVLFHTIQ